MKEGQDKWIMGINEFVAKIYRKDEFSTQNQIKRHERLQHEIGQFAETIRELAVRAGELIDEGSGLSEQIRLRQAQIEKLYAGLQDLSRERRKRLDETLQLYDLHREIDDLLQWIADKEAIKLMRNYLYFD
jgi:uncharacterized phage infection (PIP) family protein YhgE